MCTIMFIFHIYSANHSAHIFMHTQNPSYFMEDNALLVLFRLARWLFCHFTRWLFCHFTRWLLSDHIIIDPWFH